MTYWVISCQNHYCGTAVILFNSWKDNGVHSLSKGISIKVNVIARLEFELISRMQSRTFAITLDQLKKFEPEAGFHSTNENSK